jgi:hypothetical protein
MIRRFVPNIILILLCSSAAVKVFAQPSLPDINAAIEKEGVVLSWNCQYSGVKAISVLRSKDSINDFELIGYVKKTETGVQTYTDAHPPAGRNYYKLAIVFNKGLTWRSNQVGIYVNKAMAETKREPDNAAKPTQPAAQLESSFTKDKPKSQPDTCKKTANAQTRISVSFAPDTTSKKPEVPRPRVHMPFDEPAENIPIFIQSKYIHTDTATGHVDMFLPDDVGTHHYSVKFFDKDKHVIMEVPKINTARIIIDKRNFQRKGVYKFTLRKDWVEIESGYIIVDPN